MHEDLLDVGEALERLLTSLEPLGVEAVTLDQAAGRVLAQAVAADVDLPPFANSAMDGFAVRAEDVSGARPEGPVRLRVVGECAAGHVPTHRLLTGEAMRIATGAMLPPGGDAVVPVEATGEPAPMAGRPLPEAVAVHAAVRPGEFVRAAGSDVTAGQQVLQPGRRLRPADVAMLAAVGISRPSVYRRARVAVLASGDELQEPGRPLAPGRIRDSNSFGVAAAVTGCGGLAERLGILPDAEQAVENGLDRAVDQGADLIVSSAGVSAGALDLLRGAVERRGRLDFWRVNMRPGRPLAVGAYRAVPFLGLPGNPVSSLVTFEVFGRAALDRLHGLPGTERQIVQARLDAAVTSDGRESYLRGELRRVEGEPRVRLIAGQDSHRLSGMVQANALVRIPAGVRQVAAGQQVETWILPA